mmetsp:Transcript_69472/g.203273  ORF Transcript_69472/g.203273 Transcript_69472/m.203273 type:complete len:356 (+) Transcript_69472:87-1154(+)
MALAVQDRLAGAAADLESQDDGKVYSALAILAMAGDGGKSHFGKILDIAKTSSNFAVKRAALEAMALTCQGQEAQATPVMEENLTSNDPGVRRAAAQGLGQVKSEGSIAKLSPLLMDSQMLVRNAAMAALGAVGAKAGSEAGAVAANLRAPLLRVDAIRAIGKMGKEGAAHASEIAVFLEDSDPNVRLAVGEALHDMGDHVPDSVAEKAGELLAHQQDRFRATAALALGSCGMARAGKHVVTLKQMLRENVPTFSPLLSPNCAAAVALGRLGTEGELLIGFLKSKNGRMRAAVCQAVAEMGKAGLSHASAIAKCLEEDEDDGVRGAAFAALEKLQKAGSLDSPAAAAMDAYRSGQ